MSDHPKIIIYNDENSPNINVRFEGDNIWLTQLQLADLYSTTKQNIGQHIKNIFSEEELKEDSVVKKIFTTATATSN